MKALPNYLDQLPPSARYGGNAAAGEIEITTSGRASEPEEPGETGVVYEDRYILVVRDAVEFPSGAKGTYLRIFSRAGLDGPAGVVILAWRENQLALRRMFRHATRHWEIEAPRGARDGGSASRAAEKELVEEIGLNARRLEHLGEIWPDTGLLSTSVVVFWAELEEGSPQPVPEDQEALGDLVFLDPESLRTEIRSGRLRDGVTLAALSLAIAHGKLHLS